MYNLPYSAAIFLASNVLCYARHTVLISSGGEHSYLPSSSAPDVCTRPKCVIEASTLLTSLDETVDPCDDFHRFACGGWMKRTEYPDDEAEIDVFSEIQNNLNLRFKDILESEYKVSDPPFVKMLKDVYNTCLDLDKIEKLGSEPLKKMLNRLGGWPVLEGDKWDESTFDWLDTLIKFRKLGLNHNILLRLGVHPKNENDTVNIIHMRPPYDFVPHGTNLTLGLSDEKIAAYFKTIKEAATLLGADKSAAEKEMLEVIQLMIALEKTTVIEEEVKEESNETAVVEEKVNYYTVKELQEEVPKISWKKYFKGILNVEVYENETVYTRNAIIFFNRLADLLESTEKRVIANYMMMQAVLFSAPYLSEEWDSINQAIKEIEYGMDRTKSIRWKTCVYTLKRGMELPMSSFYVRNYFNDGSKDQAMILVKYIRNEFLRMLEENDWMDQKTKEKAEEKAKALNAYIGFPDELLDDAFIMKIVENITMSPDNYFENALTMQKLIVDKQLSDFRKAEDQMDTRFEYLMMVNAFYSPYDNSMGIPAGILQDAFYEKQRPNYMNFGAVGYVIGHEITHGFDNDGRHFDKEGKKVNWWDKESDEQFTKKVQCIIDQYDNYTTDTGEKINGENTQNENIADNGGLKEAYWAYQAWTKDNGIEPRLPALNYTQNQLFWLSAAHVWCSKTKPEVLKMKLLWDSHSPERYRIIGPMSNMEEFSRDFKCSPDAPMNRKYKCKVW